MDPQKKATFKAQRKSVVKKQKLKKKPNYEEEGSDDEDR